jgi:hypothetical protein
MIVPKFTAILGTKPRAQYIFQLEQSYSFTSIQSIHGIGHSPQLQIQTVGKGQCHSYYSSALKPISAYFLHYVLELDEFRRSFSTIN